MTYHTSTLTAAMMDRLIRTGTLEETVHVITPDPCADVARVPTRSGAPVRGRSRYTPHQGKRETERRRKRMVKP